MRAQESHLRDDVVNRGSEATYRPAKRRGERDLAARHRESREETVNFTQADTANIRVPGIIESEVVPQEPSTRRQHSIHFSGNAVSHLGIQE